LTHNSWFLNSILPRILDVPPELHDVTITPSTFFNALDFQLWMDNGAVLPASAKKLSLNTMQ